MSINSVKSYTEAELKKKLLIKKNAYFSPRHYYFLLPCSIIYFRDSRLYQYSILVFISFTRKLQHRCFLVNFANFLRMFLYRQTPPGGCFWHIKNKKGKQIHMCNQEDFQLEKYTIHYCNVDVTLHGLEK